MQQNTLWNDVLKKLEKRINRPSFNTWLRPTCLISSSEKTICIGVPDDVFVYWLGEYYVSVINDTLAEILGVQPEISFIVMDDEGHNDVPKAHPETPNVLPRNDPDSRQPSLNLVWKQSIQTSTTRYTGIASKTAAHPVIVSQNLLRDDSQKHPEIATKSNVTSQPPFAKVSQRKLPGQTSDNGGEKHHLNPKYTFDSFVVGNSNGFGHAAALAVAEQMGGNYNPLFIYGGVGLGKTHLLHAIGNHVAALRRTKQILYLSSEQFINELVGSIRQDRMTHFRKKYRNIDLLLIDDIQFIARKERTQEEFFHTFNTLYHERKQIVLTSDCPPKKISTIAEQLRSRFEWGLIADIQPPDLETRVAILKKKTDLHQIVLPDEIALYIASKVKSNIRELEGCLSKLKAYAMFNQQKITLELARKALQDMFETRVKKITIDLVQQAVANHYQIELDSMKAQGRSRKVTLPRQIAMYLARELTNLSLPDIGRDFGGRDHTTVLYACKKVARIQANDLSVKKSIMQIKEVIQA